MGTGTSFSWQHHVRALSGNQMSVFDDAASRREEPQSRGLILNVDATTNRCTLLHEYLHPSKLLAANQGSVQVHSDGRVVVGWGDLPHFSEYLAGGTMILDGRFSADIQSYRAFRSPWTGRPTTKPVAVAKTNTSSNTVYVSWNDDSRTASWRVLAGSSQTQLVETARAPRMGFETVISVQSLGPYDVVVAYDDTGALLAQTDVFKI